MAQENDRRPVEVDPAPAAPPNLPADLAPTIYMDGLEGFVFNDAVVKMNAFEDVILRAIDGQTTIQRRVCAHLVIPHRVLDQIHDWIGQNIGRRNEQAARIAAEARAREEAIKATAPSSAGQPS